MLCRFPLSTRHGVFPCGKCEPCRFSRKNLWKHRIMLERLCHVDAAFVTLTYDDKNLPRDDGIPVLVPSDLSGFLKRLRFSVEPLRVRFYGVGEYGDRTDRPHYHVILFNYPCCIYGRTRCKDLSSERDAKNCCDVCRIVDSAWGKGLVDVGEVNSASAAYAAKYTLKRMTSVDDRRLNGRSPEFCRMSLRPGIGADAMWDVASDLLSDNGMFGRSDVPMQLMHGGKKLPLGRYLRDRLRSTMGLKKGESDEAKKEMEVKLQLLHEDWERFNEGKERYSRVTFAKYLSSVDDGVYANMMAKFNLFRRDYSL